MGGTEPQAWGVEYRRDGDDAPTATSIRVPSTLEHATWSREDAEAVAEKMREEGSYRDIKVVPVLPSHDQS